MESTQRAVLVLALLLASAGSAGAIPPVLARPDAEACRAHLDSAHGRSPDEVARSLVAEVEEAQGLVEQSLAYRAETIRVGERLKRQSREGRPLSSRDLEILNTGVVAHLALREKLYRLAEAHECWLELEEPELGGLGLTPESRLKGVLLSLSAALTLYDNYLLAISLYEEDAKLRRFLNREDRGYKIRRAELARVTEQYNSVEVRQRVRRAIGFCEEEVTRLGPGVLEDPQTAYLNLLAAQSPSYNAVKGFAPLRVLCRKLGFMGAATRDALHSLGEEGVNLFSMVFGNAVGLIESRRGKLYGRLEVARALREELRPGDILLEKTPFRLTDKLIPGYWGHAAVWLGSEEELRALGVWEDPLVKKRRRAIQGGRLVVEALRSGVELNTLEHFLNIDDVAVLRLPGLAGEDAARVVLRALRQVGKAYDFNFDVESTDRIVCSELVYVVHTAVDWPTAKALGRATVSPDNVAARALTGPLEVVSLYHDGAPVEGAPRERFAELLASARGRGRPGPSVP